MPSRPLTNQRFRYLFVNGFSKYQQRALEKYSEQKGRIYEALLLVDDEYPVAEWQELAEHVTIVRTDFQNTDTLQASLRPYTDEILAATCSSDGNVPYLRKVIPFIPACTTPTETSLEWTTEKTKMRRILRRYDKSIAPRFLVIHDDTKETIDEIEKEVGYPMVVKPSGLAASLLVSICYHREELEAVVKTTIKKIDQIYKKKRGRGEAKVLVEEFMEGDMYSIDVYVDNVGQMYFTPMVYVKTGREVGFDDFFGYMRMTPTQLNSSHTEDAQAAAVRAVKALGMRSTTCHIELIRTEDNWKVIELGPRMGGFRHEMYELSFGIDHSFNDMLVRIPEVPKIPKKVLGYTAVLQFYAKKEGKLEKIQGVYKVQALKSLQTMRIRKEIGEKCTFAKHGGDPVLELTLFDASRSNVLADIRRIEQFLNIITK